MAIAKVKDREALKVRREPHWHRLQAGWYLGFRKTGAPAVGTWIARWRIAETDQHRYQSLGPLDHLPDNERFDAAVKAAKAWFEHVSQGGTTEVLTIKDACDSYVAHLERGKRTSTAADTRRRFEQYVFHTPLARVTLDKLTPRHIEAWRHRLEDMPTASGKPRSDSSTNRDMVCLKAALNHAVKKGHITTDRAWRNELVPVKDADGKREVYLDRQQRLALIAAAPADLAPFVKALAMLPVRPGALAAATVADFDPRLSLFTVRQDKAGAGRTIKLPPAAAALFAETARHKLPTAPLFARWDGKAWDKDSWKKPVKAAAAAAGLPADATLYALRHSTITDLVAAGVDPATVATMAGTSLLMIQKNYFQLQQDAAAAALERIAL